ncbi:MAG: hypothetical protein KDA45_17150, partial [Planctomycetales bacterium]|nr:hypothetical protein [Planctomycetales bacterium]
AARFEATRLAAAGTVARLAVVPLVVAEVGFFALGVAGLGGNFVVVVFFFTALGLRAGPDLAGPLRLLRVVAARLAAGALAVVFRAVALWAAFFFNAVLALVFGLAAAVLPLRGAWTLDLVEAVFLADAFFAVVLFAVVFLLAPLFAVTFLRVVLPWLAADLADLAPRVVPGVPPRWLALGLAADFFFVAVEREGAAAGAVLVGRFFGLKALHPVNLGGR